LAGAGTIMSDPDGNNQGPTLPLVKDAWVNMGFTIDIAANRVDEYYNYQFLASHTWQSGGVAALGGMDLFANNAGPVFYDDLSVQQIPEPTVLALIGLGGFALGLRRRTH
jgi:hypothetical protein